MQSNFDFDLVIVGCGVAGSAAALSAAETAKAQNQQLRILVLERAPPSKRGGNSRYTEAYLRLESPDKLAEGFIEDMEKFSGYRSDKRYIETLANNALDTIKWLMDHGVEFDRLPTMFLTSARPRLLPVGGGLRVIDTLLSHAQSLGVQISYESTAWQLTVDEDGRINGVWVRMADGKSTLIKTKAVVLACGGFEGNEEMLTRYLGKDAYRLRTIAPGGRLNKGECIMMALQLGAKVSGQWDSYHAEPIDARAPPNAVEPVVMLFPYGIVVDSEGNRFFDEGKSTVDEIYEEFARTIFTLKDHVAYFISDQKLYKIPNYQRGLATGLPPITADTVEELAQKLGIPPEKLRRTIDEFNRAVQPGRFDPFVLDGKHTSGITPPKSNWAIPIDTPPYIAYPLTTAIVFTFGGIATDEYARVLSQDDRPIPGLYAAGEITGLYYNKYPGATSFLRGLVFGRIAGREAVNYIIREYIRA